MNYLVKKFPKKIKKTPSEWEHYNNLYVVISEMDNTPEKWNGAVTLKELCTEGGIKQIYQ